MRLIDLGDYQMKAIVMAVGLMSVLLLGNHEATAQMYQPYPYNPYWDGVQYQSYPYPQQYDPYYDLHVMHYQLYLQQYPGYPVYPSFYQPCCFIAGIPIQSTPVIRPRPNPASRPLPPRRR
jgi:hypothetical protein